MAVTRPDNEELKDFEKFMDTDGDRYLGPTLHDALEDVYLNLDEAVSDLKKEHKDELSELSDKMSEMETEMQQRIDKLEYLVDDLKEDLSNALEENIRLGGLVQ